MGEVGIIVFMWGAWVSSSPCKGQSWEHQWRTWRRWCSVGTRREYSPLSHSPLPCFWSPAWWCVFWWFLLLLPGFGLQQVGGVVMAQKFLNHEQRHGVEAHHMCHASLFWTMPEGHYFTLIIRIIFVPITGLLVFFCSGEDIHCIRQDGWCCCRLCKYLTWSVRCLWGGLSSKGGAVDS